MNDKSKYLNEALEIIKFDKKNLFIAALQKSISDSVKAAKVSDIAFIETAYNLDNSEKDDVQKVLSNLTKKDLTFIYNIDPQLWGGLKVTIGDWEFDGSLKTQLERIKNYFAN
ncbi:hypothetical protein A3D00_03745 [Candidatus Woesebacteria bacterium RIFCSPHIGHO2_02_FULL_38_9]|uniref:Uncharacterized protein n=1 Tax=Candidatus Woesebacteria bacterium RIFCSPHIGHO2_01_FULL_39_28 TaxID=1802496 RepID=A0A1F7YCD6_9BACT|nr:MAG: hypothetical protein A2627_04960 [Candidatus Woesebacteria bacterium RIFCSPHIGHO2_01_FULL_39_28]OGM33946.1 MAG: hypothetical protein A3D00_03745 [Candidatus Woesebacteria bacterium RIFCSPHIGHO2_02_FULL_38_9]OGM57544.1 MAG: hypothetical protein A3A50_06075 [Candidatus Woesebacteria bacterium RIFCSPLOWO2_01_FULL_38_20]